VRYLLVCSPDFQEKWFPKGFNRASAAKAPVIHYDREDLLQKRALQKAFGKPPLDPPALYIPSAEKFNEVVIKGLGYGCIPDLQALPEIRKGNLVEISEAARLNTAVYWYRWNRPSQLLETFSSILLTNGRRILEAPE
jgi:LysR family transcriptional regulator, chromosome initiation inhibitor